LIGDKGGAMAEPILKRMQRIVSAGLESAADAAERLNGSGVMRHAISEVDQAIDQLRGRLASAEACARQASWRQAAIRDLVNDLDRDARFAIGKGREDLAQAAVERQLDLEEEARGLKQAETEAGRESALLKASLDELCARKAKMERDYAALEAAKREARALGKDPATETKVKRAEAAFERARKAAGCAPSGIHAAPTAAAEELKAVRREDSVAQRMAALRAAPGPATKAGKGKTKKA
jgi:phage shock protein A